MLMVLDAFHPLRKAKVSCSPSWLCLHAGSLRSNMDTLNMDALTLQLRTIYMGFIVLGLQ